MNDIHRLVVTLGIAALPLGALAQGMGGHAIHHQTAAASPMGDAISPAERAADTEAMARHMDAMQAFGQKIAAATTPEARAALMAEHMKLMQDGMALMMQGGGMHGGMGENDHQMMAKCMTMMGSMMGMMKDGMSKTSAESSGPAAGGAK